MISLVLFPQALQPNMNFTDISELVCWLFTSVAKDFELGTIEKKSSK